MKKDIEIPEVKDVYIAAVKQYNEDFRTYDWNIYIINDTRSTLETVLIVSQGSDQKDVTSLMRHSLKELPSKSYAKVEFMEESVHRLNNYFYVTYFLEGKLYDKKFEFPAHSILEDNAVSLPVMSEIGVIARQQVSI